MYLSSESITRPGRGNLESQIFLCRFTTICLNGNIKIISKVLVANNMSIRARIIQIVIDINEKIIFYPQLRKFYLSHLKKDSISVIDVGTNKGQSIDFFRKINSRARLFGFEPNKKLFSQLKIKYGNNTSVVLFNLGVSSKKGKLVFHENILDETSTFEELNFDSEYLKRKAKILGVDGRGLIVDSYEVEVTTLQDFLSSQKGTFFDVLKIDVEGHELEALKGLFTVPGQKYPIRFIQLESHNDDMYVNNKQEEEIKTLLDKNGYAPVAKFKHGFGDFYEIIYENKTAL